MNTDKSNTQTEKFIQYAKGSNPDFEPDEHEKVVRAITKFLQSDEFKKDMANQTTEK